MSNLEAPINFGDVVNYYGERLRQRRVEELEDQRILLYLAILATSAGDSKLAEAANTFLDMVRDGVEDPVGEYGERYGKSLGFPLPKEIGELVSGLRKTEAGPGLPDKFDILCEEYPLVGELFSNEEVWQKVEDSGSGFEGSYIKRNVLERYFVPKVGEYTPKALDQKMVKMASKWSESFGKPLGVRRGAEIIVSKDEAQKFFVWVYENPGVLGGYTIKKN